MKMKWPDISIDDLCEKVIDYRGKTPEKVGSGVKLVTARVIKNGRILSDSQHEYVREDQYDEVMRRGIPIKGDVLITTEAPLGEVAIINSDEKIALAQRVILLRADRKKILPYYLYLSLMGPTGQGRIKSKAMGTTVLGIKNPELKKVKIPLPDLEVQRKIVGILSVYEMLLENNIRRAKILDELVQVTFKKWFINGDFPNCKQNTVNKLTNLPEGWKEIILSDHVAIKHGFAYKGEYYCNSKTKRVLLTPGNFMVGGGIKLNKIKYYDDSAESPKEYELDDHDLLVTMTDLSKSADTLGFPLLVPSSKEKIYLHNQRLGKVLPVNVGLFPKYFYYMLFRSDQYRGKVVGSASGATVKHTSPSRILDFKMVLPPIDSQIIADFNNFAKKIFWTIDNLLHANELLNEAKDILLPRLMTGMIDVDNIELPVALLARLERSTLERSTLERSTQEQQTEQITAA